MYKSFAGSVSLQEIREKLAAKKAGIPAPISIPITTTYAKSDISRASKVLARLQSLEAGREVAYITHPATECNE